MHCHLFKDILKAPVNSVLCHKDLRSLPNHKMLMVGAGREGGCCRGGLLQKRPSAALCRIEPVPAGSKRYPLLSRAETMKNAVCSSA